jgi:hypothetical protein
LPKRALAHGPVSATGKGRKGKGGLTAEGKDDLRGENFFEIKFSPRTPFSKNFKLYFNMLVAIGGVVKTDEKGLWMSFLKVHPKQ